MADRPQDSPGSPAPSASGAAGASPAPPAPPARGAPRTPPVARRTAEPPPARRTAEPPPARRTAESPPAPPAGIGARLAALRHSADLARATAVDLAVLGAHLLLYPTGVLPEHPHPAQAALPGPPRARDAHGARDAADAPGAHGAAPRAPRTHPPHPPVLLLHGFVDNRSAFALLRRSLHRNGWTDVRAVNYSPFTPDLRTAAEQLRAHVEETCALSGRRRVDIVAHSLGGLIARYYVQRMGGDARVRTLVTLGTPHAGTRAVPAFVPHPLARQMRPGSAVLAELAEPAPGCRTRFVAFWSDLDQLMIPVGSARLEHPDLSARNVKVTGIGHLTLPVHGPVAAEIRRALGSGTPHGPSRGTAADAA
jgi:hypothetical protein